MRLSKYLLSALFLLPLFLIVTNPVLAEGEKILFNSNEAELPLVPGETAQVQVTVLLKKAHEYDTNLVYCVNCPIKVRFDTPGPNDTIKQNADLSNSSGSVTAFVRSFIPGNRLIYANVTLPDATVITSQKAIISFSRVVDIAPIPNFARTTNLIIGGIDAHISNQRNFDSPKGPVREVNLVWTKGNAVEKYQVLVRPSDYINWAIPVKGVTLDTSAQVVLSSEYNYNIKISGCNSSKCIFSKEIFLAKSGLPVSIGEGPVMKKPLLGDEKIIELNGRVDYLQQQLAESKRKQDFLGTAKEQFISFFKIFWPFIK